MGKLIDRAGHRYGRLLVLKIASRVQGVTSARWECICDCGNTVTVYSHGLARGETRSCGCLKDESVKARFTKHNMSYSPTYRSWENMKSRCKNPRNKRYPAYGARGISVCPEWEKFDQFFMDMGERPRGTSLDRIDNDKGYSKDNCRWADIETQSNNRQTNVMWNGESISVAKIAERTGVPRVSLNKRIRMGMPIDEAIEHVRAHRR